MTTLLSIQRIKLKCSDILLKIVVAMISDFQNKVVQFILLFFGLLLGVMTTIFSSGFVISSIQPTPYTMWILFETIGFFTIVSGIIMFVILRDKIKAESKTKNLANKINNIIKTELENSKFNPKGDDANE